MKPQCYVLSGCSGGGKSTLLEELARRGFQTVPEPGRRIVQEEQASEGRALPWIDPQAFVDRAIAIGLEDFKGAEGETGPIFFDRSIIDAASFMAHEKGRVSQAYQSLIEKHRYASPIFLVPPWPEIFENDAERKHGLDAAIAEYERLCLAYPGFGYEIVLVPKATVAERADFVLQRIRTA